MKLNLNPFKTLFKNIAESYKKDGKVSSTRLTSYIILSMIFLFVVYFLTVGVFVVFYNSKVEIPNEMIIVFGSLLTHQLAILGINKHNETKEKIAHKKFMSNNVEKNIEI